MFVGSKTMNATGKTSILLFTKEEFEDLCGRSFRSSTDFVGAMNGDISATGTHIDGVQYSPNDGIYATFQAAFSGVIRINYLIILGENNATPVS